MDLLQAFKIAWQNLLHRRVRSWLTLIGIFAGIAAVVALMSLGQGLRDAVNEQFNALGTDKFTVTGAGGGFGPPGTGSVGAVTKDDERLISRINGVQLAAGRYIEPATFSYRDESDAVFVTSLPDDPDGAVLALSLYNYDTEFGRELRYTDTNKVYLGYGIAEQEDGTFIQVGQKVSLNGVRFTVIGIAAQKGNPFFDGAVLMSESDAVNLFSLTDEYDLIGVQVAPGEDLQEVVATVERAMRRDRGLSLGEEDFEISTPDQFLDSLNTLLTTVQILLVGIAAISLFVGGIGIANTMYTAVLERNREIGIMKAIGARNNEILRIFLFESGLLGLAGGVLGVLIGAGIAKGVEFGAAQMLGTNVLQASIDPLVVIGMLVFAFILGSVCGTFPARQAARLHPVEALRK